MGGGRSKKRDWICDTGSLLLGRAYVSSAPPLRDSAFVCFGRGGVCPGTSSFHRPIIKSVQKQHHSNVRNEHVPPVARAPFTCPSMVLIKTFWGRTPTPVLLPVFRDITGGTAQKSRMMFAKFLAFVVLGYASAFSPTLSPVSPLSHLRHGKPALTCSKEFSGRISPRLRRGGMMLRMSEEEANKEDQFGFMLAP
eukprot:549714-Rhodomonas_salina.3